MPNASEVNMQACTCASLTLFFLQLIPGSGKLKSCSLKITGSWNRRKKSGCASWAFETMSDDR